MPRACAPYRARTKGNDERGVGSVKHNAVAGHCFSSWSELEAHPVWWMREIADPRAHGTTTQQKQDCALPNAPQCGFTIKVVRRQIFIETTRSIHDTRFRHVQRIGRYAGGPRQVGAAVSGRRAIALAVAVELPFLINKACHGVHFYFPRAALNLIADNGKAPPNRGTAVANQVSGRMMGHACLVWLLTQHYVLMGMDFQIWVWMVLALAVIIPVVILIARLVDNAW